VLPADLHVAVLTRVIAPFHGAGGLERHVNDLVRHLLRRGARITLVTKPLAGPAADNPFGTERLSVRTVPYWTFPFANRRGTTVLDRSSAYPLFGWRAGRLAAALVRQGGINLVHGIGAASLGYAYARRRDWLGTVPLVFNPHGMEEFGSTGPGLSRFKHVAYAPLRGAVRASARAADRTVATDRVLIPTVLKHLPVRERDVAVIPNAVDLEDIDRLSQSARAVDVRRASGLAPEERVLLSVGRLEANKGFQHLISALGSVTTARPTAGTSAPPWRLVLIGDGSYRPHLQRAVSDAGLGARVLMPGRVSDIELHAWYEAATLFVHPSIYEGSSIVTLEAMAHRRAVVATTAGGLPDKVRPGINGWVVPAGDTGALARALTDALDHWDELGPLGDESRAIVEREFAWSAVIGRLLALYEEVLAGRIDGPHS